MEVAINKQYGGFSLSIEAQVLFFAKKGIKDLYIYQAIKDRNYNYIGYKKISVEEAIALNDLFGLSIKSKDFGEYIRVEDEKIDEFHDCSIYFDRYKYERHDLDLIETIKELGCERCSNMVSNIQIVEIPDGVEYEIGDYDGMESIHEKHRSWG